MAAENGIEIDFLRKRSVRKENRVKQISEAGPTSWAGCIPSEAANHRYLDYLPAIEDPRNGRGQLDKLPQSVPEEGRSYPGFNLLDFDDEAMVQRHR